MAEKRKTAPNPLNTSLTSPEEDLKRPIGGETLPPDAGREIRKEVFMTPPGAKIEEFFAKPYRREGDEKKDSH